MKKLVLLSNSPRRQALLENLGIKFAVRQNNYREKPSPKSSPIHFALDNALGKISQALKYQKDEVLITADTIVYFKEQIIGKPQNYKEAFETVKNMCGTYHFVYTGIAVKDCATGQIFSDCEKTKVYFVKLTDKELKAYLNYIKPLDKAGAYAIQGAGALLVEKIEGCYYNVMGLPLVKLAGLLKKVKVSLLTS